jgi:tripartite-type tricarboxylate transporter receptor subunit TctC
MLVKLLLFVVAVCALPASAEGLDAYPSKPVQILVSHPIGSGPDAAARIIADALSKKWGVPVVTINKTGYAGAQGAAEAFLARDGYTLLVAGTGPLVINPLLMKSVPYDAQRFVPVFNIGWASALIVARRDLPARDLKSLIELARRERITYATSNTRNVHHMTGEAFAHVAGVEIVNVPYKTPAAAVADVMAGRVDLLIDTLPVVQQHIDAGHLKPIAFVTSKRNPAYPDVETVNETFRGFSGDGMQALVAPPGTSHELARQINGTIDELYAQGLHARLEALGTVDGGGSLEKTAQAMEHHYRSWVWLRERAGIAPE